MAEERRSEISQERLNTMVATTDGFRIAEIDLKLRGPGEFFGTASGDSGVSHRQPSARPGNPGMGQARGGGFHRAPALAARVGGLRHYLRTSGRAATAWRAWRKIVFSSQKL